MFSWCEISISGLMCCSFPISLASFGVCKQDSQHLPLQQPLGYFAGPGYCWNFIPLLSVALGKFVKATCVLPLYVRDTSSGVETGKWGGTGGGEGEQGSIPVVHASGWGGKRWGEGGGIVYCAKGKQRGHSAGAYWHKPQQWLRASPLAVSDGQNRPLPCLVGSCADRLLVEGWVLLGELARGQDPLADSLPSGDRHVRKATTIKLGASSTRSHLWILLKASCSGAQSKSYFCLGWPHGAHPALSSHPWPLSPLSRLPPLVWLGVKGADFPAEQLRHKAESDSSTMYHFGLWAGPVQAACEGWACSGNLNLSHGCSTSLVHAVPWKYSQRVLLFI